MSTTQLVPPRIKRVLDAAAKQWFDDEIAYLSSHGLTVAGAPYQRLKEKQRSYVRTMIHHYTVANLRNIAVSQGVSFPTGGDNRGPTGGFLQAEELRTLRVTDPREYVKRLGNEHRTIAQRKKQNRGARLAESRQMPETQPTPSGYPGVNQPGEGIIVHDIHDVIELRPGTNDHYDFIIEMNEREFIEEERAHGVFLTDNPLSLMELKLFLLFSLCIFETGKIFQVPFFLRNIRSTAVGTSLVVGAKNTHRRWRSAMFVNDPLTSADESFGERPAGGFSAQALISEYFNVSDPAPAADVQVDTEDEKNMVMLDNTLSNMYGEQLGWTGVRVLQKIRSRLRSLRSQVNERDVNTIIEAIVKHGATVDMLTTFWQSTTRDERLGYLLTAQVHRPELLMKDDDEQGGLPAGATLGEEVIEIKETLQFTFPDMDPGEMTKLEVTVENELAVEYTEKEQRWRSQYDVHVQKVIDSQEGCFESRPVYRAWVKRDYNWLNNLVEPDYIVQWPLEDADCEGHPKRWNEDVGNTECLESFYFTKKTRKTVWSPYEVDRIDPNEPLQWLARRTHDGVSLGEYLGPGYYAGDGWFRYALDPSLDHVADPEMHGDTNYEEIHHGTKIMALANVVRYGVAVSLRHVTRTPLLRRHARFLRVPTWQGLQVQ